MFRAGLCQQTTRYLWPSLPLYSLDRRGAVHSCSQQVTRPPQEALDGKAVDWMEKVTEEQYQAGSMAE